MAEELFTETTSEVDSTDAQATADALFVVGERKYDVDAARKKIENADQHIKTIEQENADLRTELEKAKTMDEVLAAIKPNQNDAQETSSISTEDLASIVDERLTRLDKVKEATSNRKEVGRMMADKFGEKAKDEMVRVGETMGLGPETLQSIAEKSPKAFMHLFANAPTTSAATNTTSNINIEALASSEPKQRTYAWYQKMHKENPKLYNSAKVQSAMHKDAVDLGLEEFMAD